MPLWLCTVRKKEQSSIIPCQGGGGNRADARVQLDQRDGADSGL